MTRRSDPRMSPLAFHAVDCGYWNRHLRTKDSAPNGCNCKNARQTATLPDSWRGTPGDPGTILRIAINRSGLSARRFATDILIRDERTIRRWLAGDSPIPKAVVEFLKNRLAR